MDSAHGTIHEHISWLDHQVRRLIRKTPLPSISISCYVLQFTKMCLGKIHSLLTLQGTFGVREYAVSFAAYVGAVIHGNGIIYM